MDNSLYFNSPTLGKLSYEQMVSYIVQYIISDEKSSYLLVIGTDSQVKKLNGVAECDYVTAIVVQKKGQGAKYFWKKEKVSIPPVLRDKIYKETTTSLDTAQLLVPQVKKAINGTSKYELEIHIDVGSNGPTRDMIKEVVGMVTGLGYTAKTKPQSWGASSVADRHT